MAQVLTDLGADEILKAYFNNNFPLNKDLSLRLFTNNRSPLDTDITSDYIEAIGGGYLTKDILSGSWAVNTINNPSDAEYFQQLWTFTGSLTGNSTIYGYYVVNSDNVLLWIETLNTPFTPVSNGDKLAITLKFQLSKGTTS